MSNSPTKEQAFQFALMLSAGAPAAEAIRYFLPEDITEVFSSGQLGEMLQGWLRNRTVQSAIKELQGKEWTDLSFDEKLQLAAKKTYTEMAYFLYTRNVAELTGADLAKAEGFRKALEAKLAGTAGQLTEVERFWSDLASGKVKLIATGAGSRGEAPLTQRPGAVGEA